MKNVTELRNDLLDVYEKTKKGEVDLKTASELANVAGKVIKITAVELAYLQFTKSDRKIKFLES